MRSLMPIRCPVLFKGILLTTVVLYHDTSLGVMAACTTSLPDATPAAGETFTIPSGACAANINIAAGNDGVTIKFLSGAEPFQAGKSIVLPASGVVVGLKVRFTGVNWGAVSQQVFSGGHATALELKGLDVEFQGTTITSSVTNPIGLLGMLTTSSRYTVSSSTISVSTSGTCQGLRFSGAITDSTLSLTHGSVVTATSGLFSGVNGIAFFGDLTGSSFCMSQGSSMSATSDQGGYAYGIYFSAFTNSNLCMRDGSTVSCANPSNQAKGISFSSAFTSSTVCMTDGSQSTATGGSTAPIHPSSTTVASQCDPSVCPAPTATATLLEVPPRTRTVSLPMTTPAPMTTAPATATPAVSSSASATSDSAVTIATAATVVGTSAAATTSAAAVTTAATTAAATTAASTTAPATTTAATTTAATSTAAAVGSTTSTSSSFAYFGSIGNGASSVTAAALGLVTMVLAMF